MSDQSPHHDDDDAFAERLGEMLRKPERFGDEFERDLVEAIRADRPIDQLEPRHRVFGPTWWRTPVTVRLSPLAGLALAASVAAAVVLPSLAVRSASTNASPVVAEAVHDTVNVVRFVFVGQARSVSLVGDFNGWRAEATPLAQAGATSSWTVSLPLPRGRHEYAFIVDGKRWVADPFAPASADEFDTHSSIVNVGT
jgi:hypothetical protein